MSLPSRNSLFRIIRDSYGPVTLRTTREWINSCKKHTPSRCQLAFNKTCRASNVTPRSLRVKPLVDTALGCKVARNASRQFLNARIEENYGDIRRLETEVFARSQRVTSSMDRQTILDLKSLCDWICLRVRDNARIRHDGKLSNLGIRLPGGSTPAPCNRSGPSKLVNLSGRTLTPGETSLLNLGLKFAIAPRSVSVEKIAAEVENSLRLIPARHAEDARPRVVGILRDVKIPPSNLNPRELLALKNLKSDNSIIILPADKGGSTVIMDRSEYVRKMKAMLADGDTYEVVRKDPVKDTERKLRVVLQPIKEIMGDKAYFALNSTAGQIPRIYGLPKVHKDQVPLRPIVSFIGSPTYALSKFLVKILGPLMGRKDSHVRNSFDFVAQLRGIVLKDNEVLLSLDVVSLFTNVPTTLALDVIKMRLEDDVDLGDRCALDIPDILLALKLTLDDTFIMFEGIIYHQKFGIAMGSPVSMVVANVVMESIEDRALRLLASPPPFYKRYVDDCVGAVEEENVQTTLDTFNSVNPHIQFTMELEDKNSLPFLDARICKNDDGTLRTDVYRKSISVDNVIPFHSGHPLRQKLGLISFFALRAQRICTLKSDLEREINFIRRMFKHAGYPSGLVEKEINGTLARNLHPLPPPSSDSTPPPDMADGETGSARKYCTLPYIRGVSDRLKRVLNKYDIKVAFRAENTLRRIFGTPKDPIPVAQTTNCVYHIPCLSCGTSYVGQTKRRFETRIREHKTAVRNLDANASATAEHYISTGHLMDWDNGKVLDTELRYYKRLFLEAWRTRTLGAGLNRDLFKIPEAYNCLISRK